MPIHIPTECQQGDRDAGTGAGRALFERTSRGLRVTPYGETVREYAHNILNHVSLINSLAEDTQERKFTVSTYPSNMIASF